MRSVPSDSARPLVETQSILGVDVALLGARDCASLASYWLEEPSSTHSIVCANPHSLVEAQEDLEFKRALKTADLVVPDGVGVALAARLLGGPVLSRFTGSDVFDCVNSVAARCLRNRVFLLGSTPGVLARMKSKMEAEYDGLTVVGMLSPPFAQRFTESQVEAMVGRVNASKADILWVGMTAPKQEKWIMQSKAQLEVPVVGAVGAVFDFVAGTKKRPSAFLRRHGLEWLGRLARDPQRLWRRSLVSAPRFVCLVTAERRRNAN